jgi:two-component system OmpR family sensor kinase
MTHVFPPLATRTGPKGANRDPERRIWRRLPGIRLQLTLWYTAMFAGVLLLAVGVTYGALKLTLDWRVDASLDTQAQHIAAGISDEHGTIVIRNVTGLLPGLPVAGKTPPAEGSLDDGTLVRVLSPQASVVYTSPAFRGIILPTASVSTPRMGKSWTDTIRVRGLEAARFYSEPVIANGRVFAILQVGQSLDLVTTTLGISAVVLAVLFPLLLLVTAFIAYWLAGRAFAPVRRLTQFARAAQATNLAVRAPVPRIHDEIRELALTLNDLLARLDAAFTAQRRFIADASHDLRTPVAVLLSLAENARDHMGERDQGEVLGDIAQQAQRLGGLLSNLLALARADEGQLALEREPLWLDRLAGDAVTSLLLLASERGLVLQTGTLEPALVDGDLARLLLVLLNLIENALTYTTAGGQVTVSVVRTPRWAELTVLDTGVGISAADAPHVFERFYRADGARQRERAGSGLGLAIAQTLVEAHGGTITLSSTVGVGSRFVVALPLSSQQPLRLEASSD